MGKNAESAIHGSLLLQQRFSLALQFANFRVEQAPFRTVTSVLLFNTINGYGPGRNIRERGGQISCALVISISDATYVMLDL